MEDFAQIIFYINIAWIFTHELDAIRNHEWRVFQELIPHFNRLSDVTAYQVFTALHIPLFGLLIALAPSQTFQFILDIFLLVHIGLHWRFRNVPSYEFQSLFSRFIIAGVAPLAILHLLLLALI